MTTEPSTLHLITAPTDVEMATNFAVPYALAGILNAIHSHVPAPKMAQIFALLQSSKVSNNQRHRALAAAFYWALDQQSKVAKERDDYICTMNWLMALRDGEVSLLEQAWHEPSNHSTPNSNSLIELIRSVMGIERACALDAGVRINYAAYGMFDAARTVKLAAERTNDPEVFCANIANFIAIQLL